MARIKSPFAFPFSLICSTRNHGSFALLLLFGFLITQQLFSQAPECDGWRYVSEIFPNYLSTTNITYGQNLNYFGSNTTLQLDIYEPDGDTQAFRPLILMAHGGSFLYGDKAFPDMLPLAQAFTRKGYVVASFNYRLGMNGLPFPGPDSTAATEEVMRSVQDAKAAVRFLYKDRMTTNTYRIDTSRIFFLGTSAGGFIALHYAYLDRISEIPADVDTTRPGLGGGLEGNSGNPGYPTRIHAIVSLAGALGDTSWMEPGGLPVLSMHGTNDGTVPYGTDVIVLSGQWPLLEVDGSHSVHIRAANLGYDNCLYTHYGSGHVEYVNDTAYLDTTINIVTWWLQGKACGTASSCNFAPIAVGNSAAVATRDIRTWPNPARGESRIEIPQGWGEVTLTVCDLSGRILDKPLTLPEGYHTLSLSQYPAGLYILRFNTPTRTRHIRLVVE